MFVFDVINGISTKCCYMFQNVCNERKSIWIMKKDIDTMKSIASAPINEVVKSICFISIGALFYFKNEKI